MSNIIASLLCHDSFIDLTYNIIILVVPNDTESMDMATNIWTTTLTSEANEVTTEMITTVLQSSAPTTGYDSITNIQATAAPATGCSGRIIGLIMRQVQDVECQVEEHITRNEKLKKVFNMVCSANKSLYFRYSIGQSIIPIQIRNRSHLPALKLLRESVVAAIRAGEINLTAPVYLLSTIVNDFGNENTDSAISEVYHYVRHMLRCSTVINWHAHDIMQLLLSVSSDLLKTAREDFEHRVTVSY